MKEYKNLDLKQLIPIYGTYKILKDNRDGKPSLADLNHPIRMVISSLYQGCAFGGLVTSLFVGLEKLLQ